MMNFFYQPWPYLTTALLVALLGLYVRKQPQRPGTYYFGWIVAIWFVWALMAALTTFVIGNAPLLYVLWVIKSTIALLMSPMAVMFALEYTGNVKWLTRRSLIVLSLPALTFALLAIILPSSVFVSIEIAYNLVVIQPHYYTRAAIFAVSSGIWLINFYILMSCMLQAPGFKTPILWILLGQVFPLTAYLFLESQLINVSANQALLVLSSFTAITYFVAVYYFRILQIMPVARDTAFNHMPYAVFVLDSANRLVDFNQAAKTLPGLSGKLKPGLAASQMFGSWWENLSGMISPITASQDVAIQTDVGVLHFDVKSIPLLHPNGWRIGQILIVEDTTQLWQAQQQQVHTAWAKATFQEREQLADELHDGLSQNLAYLNLQAQTAQLYLQNHQSEAARVSLERLTAGAEEIQDDTRELISVLMSERLPVENFFSAMQEIVANFEKRSCLTAVVNLETNGYPAERGEDRFGPTQMPAPIGVQLIRITQEALANVRKHAGSTTKVNVVLKSNEGEVVLVIEDNGEGFDPAAVESNGQHFGLQVMRNRAERIGGQVFLYSIPGEGTRVEVRVPAAVDTLGNSE